MEKYIELINFGIYFRLKGIVGNQYTTVKARDVEDATSKLKDEMPEADIFRVFQEREN